MKTHVMYHSNCYDGFGSAYAAWKHFGDKADYFPVSYGELPPQLLGKGSTPNEIIIVDFSYNEKTLIKLHEKFNCEITILDHHKTAQAMLEPLADKYYWLHVNFDMNRSGALMTWEHYHKGQVPELIKHISDRDLWTFKLEGTKEVHMALVSYPMEFGLWDLFDVEELKKEGKVLNRLYVNLVKNICSKAFETEIDDSIVPVVNTSIAWSEVGACLLSMYPQAPFVASFTVFEDNVMWSLRSRKDFDVSEVAKRFGGGGHAQAAGFKTPKF